MSRKAEGTTTWREEECLMQADSLVGLTWRRLRGLRAVRDKQTANIELQVAVGHYSDWLAQDRLQTVRDIIDAKYELNIFIRFRQIAQGRG